MNLGESICGEQPCVYTDVDGNPTMYASGRPAWHIGGDDSIDTTGKYLNPDGSSRYPGADGLLDEGWKGPTLPNGYPDVRYMERSSGKSYEQIMQEHEGKRQKLQALRQARMAESDHMVGAFFYDPDLAKFGNAFSPFVQTDSFERANLALQRPFEDRYNPRYDRQPTWAEWMDMDAPWFQTMGAFDVVTEKTGIAGGTVVAALAIAGITAILAARSPKHSLEIIAGGALGVAGALAFDLGKSKGLRRE